MNQNITYNLTVIINSNDIRYYSSIPLAKLISLLQEYNPNKYHIRVTTFINGLFNNTDTIS